MDGEKNKKHLSMDEIELEIEKRREETLDRILTTLRESGYKFDDNET